MEAKKFRLPQDWERILGFLNVVDAISGSPSPMPQLFQVFHNLNEKLFLDWESNLGLLRNSREQVPLYHRLN